MISKQAIPWEKKPADCKDVMWRYSKNPIIGRYDTPTSSKKFHMVYLRHQFNINQYRLKPWLTLSQMIVPHAGAALMNVPSRQLQKEIYTLLMRKFVPTAVHAWMFARLMQFIRNNTTHCYFQRQSPRPYRGLSRFITTGAFKPAF
jgi:hypothetical protein